MWTSACLVIGVVAVNLHCVSGVGECAFDQREINPTGCLNAIKTEMNSYDRFWFGNNFGTQCGGLNKDPIDCDTTAGTTAKTPPQSLKSLVFPSTVIDMDRYVSVTFNSPAGEYMGCDTKVSMAGTTIEADPLADESYTSWSLRKLPEITWSTSGMDGKYRVVIVIIEIPSSRVLGLYSNVPGFDGRLGDTYRANYEYTGPMTVRSGANPVVVALFKQSLIQVDINIDSLWTPLPTGTGYTLQLEALASQYNLQGPIAINWVLAGRDAYSADSRNNGGLADSCATLVQQAVLSQNRPFLPGDPPLSVFLSLTFDSDDQTVNFCCQDTTYPGAVTVLDPLSNGVVKPADVRSPSTGVTGSTQTISAVKYKFYPDMVNDFQGKYYTLIALDPDVPFPTAGTNERPLLHFLVMNMNGVIDPSQGEVLRSYSGPKPPDDKPHYYYFLLYEQPEYYGGVNASEYTDGSERFLFDIYFFVEDYELELLGASWMVANNDDFVNSFNKQRGRLTEEQEEELCANRPCTSGGSRNIVCILLTSFLAILTKLTVFLL